MRPPDWPERLARYIDSRAAEPFAWGENDCASFASAWVEQMRGETIGLPPHGTAASAAQSLRARGGLEAAASDVLGVPIDAMLAQRGDIAMVRIAGRESLSVVVGEYAAGPGPNGVVLVPMADAVVAWRV